MIGTIPTMIVALGALVALNVPIAIALGVIAVVAIWVTQGAYMLPNLALVMFEGATSFPLLAIPMFILAGAIMNSSSITQRLMDLAVAMVGFIRGGLAHVNIVQSMFFAEISGSAVADVAATGPIIMPAMIKRGYSREFTAAVTSSSASLAIIIPPSIPMILYGVIGNVSIVQLFVAGIIPGILGGLGMMAISYYLARKLGWPVEDRFRLDRLWETFKASSWALLLPVIILGGIFGGFVTATEGAALAVLAALFVGGVIHRDLDLAHLYRSAVDGAIQTAVVMLLIATSALLGVYLTEQQIPQRIAEGMMSITSNPYAILAILNVFLLILGLFLHSAAAIILVVPIVLPLVIAAGIDPVHFGIIVTLNLAIGQQTPPVASVLIATCAIAKADIWEVTKVNTWFIGVLLAVLLLVTYVPPVSMGLVDYFYR
ncbi:MAG TPA: TRAP transporter large permease [Xanthobacteraceae bacterium]|nr:TRAP transporter large permease [Xanthobacteraceae bacterium]